MHRTQASKVFSFFFFFFKLLCLPFRKPPPRRVYHFLLSPTCRLLRRPLHPNELHAWSCWALRSALVWNRRWIPRTAGRVFVTGALFSAAATCQKPHMWLCTCMKELRVLMHGSRYDQRSRGEGKSQREKDVDELEGQIHYASAVQDNQNDRDINCQD